MLWRRIWSVTKTIQRIPGVYAPNFQSIGPNLWPVARNRQAYKQTYTHWRSVGGLSAQCRDAGGSFRRPELSAGGGKSAAGATPGVTWSRDVTAPASSRLPVSSSASDMTEGGSRGALPPLALWLLLPLVSHSTFASSQNSDKIPLGRSTWHDFDF